MKTTSETYLSEEEMGCPHLGEQTPYRPNPRSINTNTGKKYPKRSTGSIRCPVCLCFYVLLLVPLVSLRTFIVCKVCPGMMILAISARSGASLIVANFMMFVDDPRYVVTQLRTSQEIM
jgi:hypothetical protein